MLKLMSLADGITLLNALFGFGALILIYFQQMYAAFSLILLALLADGLDGVIARKYGHSKLGDYLEAMADMLSLTIAPVVYLLLHQYTNGSLLLDLATSTGYINTIVLLVVLGVFLVSSMIRLSSFHILKEHWFIGLPASASAIMLLALTNLTISFYPLIVIILVLGLMMISPLRYPKTGVILSILATVLIFSTVLLGILDFTFASTLLLAGVLIYLLGGPLYIKYIYTSKKNMQNI